MLESKLAFLGGTRLSLSPYVYYYALRSSARIHVADKINSRTRGTKLRSSWDITIGSIDKEALDYSRVNWPKYYGPDTFAGLPHSWDKLFHSFSMRPSYFDLAVWVNHDTGRSLAGLALGRPSNSKRILTINWIERSFGPHYFSGGVLLPILACAEEYGRLIGSERVMLRDPVDPGVFERYGYHYVSRSGVAGRYLCKEL
jgi:hypothetical protein